MDLLSSIRKEGSRGGVDFKWSDVTTSQHRENYLGHSLMAPVGRWQKNRDLNWYAKGDSENILNKDGTIETAEERQARERREEIRRIKEAEEDALARALGLPVVDRVINAMGTGANGIDVGEVKRVIKETEAGDEEIEAVGRGRGFGDFVGKMTTDGLDRSSGLDANMQRGGLLGKDSTPRRVKRSTRTEDRSRSRSRSRDRRHDRDNGGRHRYRERQSRPEWRERSRSPQRRRERSRETRGKEGIYSRSRSRSPVRRDRRDDRDRERDRERERDRDRRGSGAEYRAAQNRRSRPPDPRDRDRESRRHTGGEREREKWR